MCRWATATGGVSDTVSVELKGREGILGSKGARKSRESRCAEKGESGARRDAAKRTEWEQKVQDQEDGGGRESFMRAKRKRARDLGAHKESLGFRNVTKTRVIYERESGTVERAQ
jgi:hypothetical protein